MVSNASPLICLTSWLIACLFSIEASAGAAPSNRIAEIRVRGELSCGVWPYVAGFSIKRNDDYTGFDIDICRAVAAAVFGDATKVKFVTLANVKEFTQRNDIDLVVRRLTWTPSRETATGFEFGPIVFYDGQGFLIPKNSGIESIAQFNGDRLCVLNMERHPETLFNYLKDNGRDIQLVLVENDEEAAEALEKVSQVASAGRLGRKK